MEAFLSNQFRVQGEWIAQNALAVLAVALIIAVVLCLGLFLLTVETRPEKLWVAPGSQAAEEKEFFDTHLAPFYRIEQVFFFAFVHQVKLSTTSDFWLFVLHMYPFCVLIVIHCLMHWRTN
jgi:hypothetical protein